MRPGEPEFINGASSARILIVEDEPANGRLLREILLHEGHDVRVAGDAVEALALAPVFRPAVMVVDLRLPGMSGLLLGQRLKEDAATRDIVLIAVTSINDGAVERMARDAGFVAYLRKPIDGEAFAALVAAQLRGTP